jgi:hypothetical protein
MGLVPPGGASLAVTSGIPPAAQGAVDAQDARLNLRCESRRGSVAEGRCYEAEAEEVTVAHAIIPKY